MSKDKRLLVKQQAVESYKRMGCSQKEAEDMVIADLDHRYTPPKDSKMEKCRCAIKVLVEAETKQWPN